MCLCYDLLRSSYTCLDVLQRTTYSTLTTHQHTTTHTRTPSKHIKPLSFLFLSLLSLSHHTHTTQQPTEELTIFLIPCSFLITYLILMYSSYCSYSYRVSIDFSFIIYFNLDYNFLYWVN